MKHCNKCNTDKPLEAFNKNRNNPDGRNYVCRECYKSYAGPLREKKLTAKAAKRARAKKRLENAPPPDVDAALHKCAVRAADELAILNVAGSGTLSGNDVSKMRSLIDILLVIRKNARPVKKEKEEKVEPANDELFE